MTATRTAATGTDQTTKLKNLHRRTYPLRVLGMGLACLPVSAVMWELQSPAVTWGWMFFSCLAWPHLAYVLANRSRDPLRAELRNFVFDSFIAGSWVPLMHFNALPSAVLLAVVMSDKINTGIRGLWLRSMPWMIIALIASGIVNGFAFQPNTSMTVLLASLPILIIHTIAVSMTSYRLVRRVQSQNQLLEQLSRVDTLTGLDSRGHWQNQAENLLLKHHSEGSDATLMLLDVDQFKDINDGYGHAVGDDVLRGIAELIKSHLPKDCHAGRLGGDEFVVAMPIPIKKTESIAEKIRTAVEVANFVHAPRLQCSISIGIAQPMHDCSLRDWLEIADRALYRAKHAGRNRIESRDLSMEHKSAGIPL